VKCGWDETYGHLGHAYQVFVGLEKELGRPLSYSDILVVTIYHEYGWFREGLTDEQFQTAVETTGRILYHFCGANGICVGDQLWNFLGYHDGFTHRYRPESIQEVANMLMSGGYSAFREAASQILTQPSFDLETATDADMLNNWRSGTAGGLPVPFVYGNYNMFREATRSALSKAPTGIAVNALIVNIPDINNGNGWVVMTQGQRSYWKSE
jgi:hypothetical protein